MRTVVVRLWFVVVCLRLVSFAFIAFIAAIACATLLIAARPGWSRSRRAPESCIAVAKGETRLSKWRQLRPWYLPPLLALLFVACTSRYIAASVPTKFLRSASCCVCTLQGRLCTPCPCSALRVLSAIPLKLNRITRWLTGPPLHGEKKRTCNTTRLHGPPLPPRFKSAHTCKHVGMEPGMWGSPPPCAY